MVWKWQTKDKKISFSKLGETSLTEYRHKMRSGNLPAYLSLNGPSNGSFMLLMLFCSILALLSFRWRIIMFLVLFCFILVKILDFLEIPLVCDGRTDRRTDGWTDKHKKRDFRQSTITGDRQTGGRTSAITFSDAYSLLKIF